MRRRRRLVARWRLRCRGFWSPQTWRGWRERGIGLFVRLTRRWTLFTLLPPQIPTSASLTIIQSLAVGKTHPRIYAPRPRSIAGGFTYYIDECDRGWLDQNTEEAHVDVSGALGQGKEPEANPFRQRTGSARSLFIRERPSRRPSFLPSCPRLFPTLFSLSGALPSLPLSVHPRTRWCPATSL